MEQTTTPNPGKGMGTAGFVISLIGLVAGIGVYIYCGAQALMGQGGHGLAIFWAVLCLAGLVLSIMGMNKSKKAGHKPGLAMGGLIVGILAVLLSIWTVVTVVTVNAAYDAAGVNMEEALNDLENLGKELEEAADSMENANQ